MQQSECYPLTGKNIQVLTSEYPNDNSEYDTPIVHYFVKEWVKNGNNVEVIHFRSVFPVYLYWISIVFNKIIKRIAKTDFIPTKRLSKISENCIDGIKVKSVPIFKLLPHIKYSDRTIRKHVYNIINENKINNFEPDIIIGHFFNPQIVIVNLLQQYYPKAKTCIVLHEDPLIIKQKFPKNYMSLLQGIDIWGFRFKAMESRFIELYGDFYSTFICYSGVPSNYINYEIEPKKFNEELKYCFAGMLIPLKNVDIIIKSLTNAYPKKQFIFNILGEGMDQKNLESIVADLGLKSNIHFIGKTSRDEVLEYLSISDCFVMVSEPEAFGLVYLEAMARGCITIGTKGQGIDGVIVDGLNGFLCKSRNIDELESIIKKINNMTSKQLQVISKNALETAKEMTDEKVAKKYLDTILNLPKKHYKNDK